MILALTGGTGGAKLVQGLAAEIDPADLTIICNTADDAIFHGLYVSPDIDTIKRVGAWLAKPLSVWNSSGAWARKYGLSSAIRIWQRIFCARPFYSKA
jgi:LPPG:FO 2-phospho-L-lactate transferase